MTFDEIMAYLEEKGNDQTKKVLMKHGAREPFFGVKVGDLKPIQKRLRKIMGCRSSSMRRATRTLCIWPDSLLMSRKLPKKSYKIGWSKPIGT